MPVFRALYCNYDGDVISDICIAECETDLKRINVYLDKNNFSIASDLTKYAFNNLNRINNIENKYNNTRNLRCIHSGDFIILEHYTNALTIISAASSIDIRLLSMQR